MFFCQFLDKNEKKEKITFPLILICTVQKETNDPKPLVQFVDHTFFLNSFLFHDNKNQMIVYHDNFFLMSSHQLNHIKQ